MNSKKRIDYSPREFSSVEIKSLLVLAAEVGKNIDDIGVYLAELANDPHLDQAKVEVASCMKILALDSRVKIDKIVSIISVEEELIKGEG